MPVRMRLATKGASRKRKISIERSPELVRGVECLLQFADVVIKKLEVVGDFFFSPDRWRQHQNLPTGFARHGVRCLQIEVWLDHNHLDVLLLHLPDELDGVLRARRNAGPRLNVADHVQVKLFRKVRPRTMIGDDLAAFVWLHLRQPFLVGLLEALFKIRVAMFEIRNVVGTHLAELVGDAFGDAQAILRIKPIVRIAERVNVAFGTSDHARGNFENFGETRSVKIAGGADLDFGIRGLGDQRRQPADFEFETDNDQEIGALELEQEAGLGVDKVRILVAAGNGFNFNFVAANFLRESGKVGGSGYDLNLAGGARSRRQNERAEQSEGGENSAQPSC